MSSFDHTFDMMDRIFPVIFWSVFVIIIGVFIAVFVGAIKQWHENNQSPILIVPAIIVAKRTRVSSSSNHTDHMENSTSHPIM